MVTDQQAAEQTRTASLELQKKLEVQYQEINEKKRVAEEELGNVRRYCHCHVLAGPGVSHLHSLTLCLRGN